VDVFEPSPIQGVQSLLSRLAHANQTTVPQNPQVLGGQRLAHSHAADEIIHRHLAPSQHAKDLAAVGLGDGIEGVGSGRKAGHASII
jgi:hypothetical protein